MVEQAHSYKNDIGIKIGDESPFGSFYSIITAPFNCSNKKSMIGIIGLLRMNYKKNYSLIDFAKSLL